MSELTQQQKLEYLIGKAIEGGWIPDRYDETERRSAELDYEFVSEWYDFRSYSENYKLFIFNHDFAKALFGDGSRCDYCGEPKGNMHPSPCPVSWPQRLQPELWQFHLQQAVISPDPISYMYKVVEGE